MSAVKRQFSTIDAKRLVSCFQSDRVDAIRRSVSLSILQYSITPSLRSAGVEHEDEPEHEHDATK